MFYVTCSLGPGLESGSLTRVGTESAGLGLWGASWGRLLHPARRPSEQAAAVCATHTGGDGQRRPRVTPDVDVSAAR